MKQIPAPFAVSSALTPPERKQGKTVRVFPYSGAVDSAGQAYCAIATSICFAMLTASRII